MANLRVDKITSTETFEKTGSVQFDGSGDYLELPDSAGFSSSDLYTIELWIYNPEVVSGSAPFFTLGTGSAGQGFSLDYTSTPALRLDYYSNSISYNVDLQDSQWHHISASFDGTTRRLFLDGTLVAQDNLTGSYTAQNVVIGRMPWVSRVYKGHISNLRILKGQALYTSNFTPPTRELEVTPETVLLACQSTTNAAEEKTGKTITVNGTAVASELTPGILTPIVKSGGGSAITGSVEFSGTGDGLVLSNSTDFAFGTGDFTIEGWFNVSDTGAIRTIFDSRTSDNASTGIFVGINSDDNLYTYGFPSSTGVTNYGIPKHGEWHHFAVVRNGSNGYAFLNGIKVSGSINTGSTDYTDQGATVGQPATVFAATLYRYKGFISNFRINKGTALYTADFIPPTRELKNVPGTVLLCCQDPNNPLTEATGKTITGYGDFDARDVGVELVANGTFDTDTSGWVAWANSIISVESGKMRIDSTATYAYVYTTISTKIGENYAISLDYDKQTSGRLYFRVGNSIDSQGLGVVTPSISGTYTLNIRATATTTYITLVIEFGSGVFAYIDNVSVTLVDGSNKGSNFTPQVGDDRKVTFEGVTKIDTDAYFYLPTGDTITRDSRSGRGVFGGGSVPGTALNTIDYINIQSTGNATDFGDLTAARYLSNSCSSTTRGLFAGGQTPTNCNIIDYITISSSSNAQDFGDLSATKDGVGSCSSSTRGLFAGGRTPTIVNTIDYVTISSTGNSISFGILSTTIGVLSGCSSPTRGIFAGGLTPTVINNIEYVTISSTGNSSDFGDLTQTRLGLGAVSSTTRGVFAGGSAPANSNIIDYITIASTGNAQDFGDLIQARTELGNGASNSIRGVFGGGLTSPLSLNILDYVTIASTGNAQDFGDLTNQRRTIPAGCSDSHGGLG